MLLLQVIVLFLIYFFSFLNEHPLPYLNMFNSALFRLFYFIQFSKSTYILHLLYGYRLIYLHFIITGGYHSEVIPRPFIPLLSTYVYVHTLYINCSKTLSLANTMNRLRLEVSALLLIA